MLTIVTGMQFGDEGKGRIVHNLASQDSFVAGARAQGADNAGHTVVHEGETYKLSLVPACVIAGKPGFLGRGMAINLDVLCDEIQQLETRGVRVRLMIDPRAHVIMPWHLDLDGINEGIQSTHAAGSTRRGVAPVYASKHERNGVRIADIFGNNSHYIRYLCLRNADLVAHYTDGSLDETFQSYLQKIEASRSRVAFLELSVGNVSSALQDLLENRKGVLGECAQGEMLDIDSPGYPQTTSSGTGASGFLQGIGLFPYGYIDHVVGVTKAYMTKVGNGPFVTEIEGNVADSLREKGREFGTRTGRARRIGWLDIPMLHYALLSSGVTGIALTKLDILGGMDEIPVALHYNDGDDEIPCLDYRDVRVQYTMMKGWPAFSQEDYRRQLEKGVSRIRDTGLRAYLELIQEKTERPISYVCFGQDSSAFLSYI